MRTTVYQDYDCVAALDKADLLVTYTCDVRPRPAQRAALARFVARGGRWLALHGTNAVIEPSTGDGRGCSRLRGSSGNWLRYSAASSWPTLRSSRTRCG